MLFESQIKSPEQGTLSSDVVVPGGTEIILEGQLEKNVACKTGIISSRPELDQLHIHVANIVVSPEGRQVPVRVMNSSEEPIALIKVKKIASFKHLSEIRSEESIHGGRQNFACGAVASNSFRLQVKEVLSPHLNE